MERWLNKRSGNESVKYIKRPTHIFILNKEKKRGETKTTCLKKRRGGG